MPEFVDRLRATLTSSAHRGGILANVGFAVLLAVSAVAFFPGRIHLVVFTIVVWSLFFGHLRPRGYGPLAIMAVLLFWLVTYADAPNYGIIRAHNVLAYTALIMAVFGMAVVAHRAARGSVRLLALLGVYLVGVVIALTALLYILHMRMFGVPVTPAVLNAIYQTQLLEVHAFLGEFGSVPKGLVVVAAVTVPALFIFGQHLTRVRRVAPLPLAAVVHLMGSHWRYCDRVPAGFPRYTGSRLDPGEFGAARTPATADLVNCYVKNLEPGNLAAVRAALGGLASSFDLRPRVIFESPAVELLGEIGRDGFHTSYYLPAERILRLSDRAANDSPRAEAARIARAADRAGVAAVSFDAALYSFVKRHLEPLLGSHVLYHTWDLELSLADPRLPANLAARPYFADPRVATILVRYESQLSL